MSKKSTVINIFAGTGGVGKTTLATSKALHEASTGKDVLLITIDPSLRLKQLLNISEKDIGKTCRVAINLKNEKNEKDEKNSIRLDVVCFNPAETLKKIYNKSNELENNRIMAILSMPFGGMNEIMAYIELTYQFFSNKYDCIVLDTPPGKNFIEFSSVFAKIDKFFNYYFLDVFKYLPAGAKKSSNKRLKNQTFLKKILNSGVDKLLHYLDKVTGPTFVNEFIQTVALLYGQKDYFLKCLEFKKIIDDSSITTVYFTTAIDQVKIEQQTNLLQQINDCINARKVLIINKIIGTHLDKWNPTIESQKILKMNLIQAEKKIIKIASQYKLKTLCFSEILKDDPRQHLNQLYKEWKNFR